MNRIKIGSFQRRITVFPCIFKLWEEILQRVLQHVNSGLNIMKLALVIQMSKSMVRIKEIIKSKNILHTVSYTFFFSLRRMGKKFSKRILAYLYCSIYNEINMRHSAVQKHVSSKKRYK